MKKEEAIRHLEEAYARIKRDSPGFKLTQCIVHATEAELDEFLEVMRDQGECEAKKKQITYFSEGGGTEWVVIVKQLAQGAAVLAGAIAVYCRTKRCKVHLKHSGDVAIDAPTADDALRIVKATDAIWLKRKRRRKK